MNNEVIALILAAGKGKRMNSSKPKVLHEVACKPMLNHIIDACKSAGIKKISVVLGKKKEEIKSVLPKGIEIVVQKEQLGTADAIKSSKPLFKKFKGKVLILYADMPLIRKETIKKIINNTKNNCTMVAFESNYPKGYGRIIKEKNNNIQIVEEKNASLKIKKINLCYSGIICSPVKILFKALDKIKKDNKTREYLFTDVFKIFGDFKVNIKMIKHNEKELMGINNRIQLNEAEKFLQNKIKADFIKRGVRFLSPETVYIASDVKISSDVIIGPNVYIGRNVNIKSAVLIKNGCSIEDSIINKFSEIGPMSRLRDNTIIGQNVKIGNFVELKNTSVGNYSKINHLSYVGDTKIGIKSNIGAGTITCNYDGVKKNKTIIGNNVFIGSNCSLIAPIKIANSSFVAAGSTISNNVAENDFTIARTRQQIIKNGRKKFLKVK